MVTLGLRIVGVIAILVAVSSTLGAQWPSYPTPDVPRAADGKPVLDGPAPRTADGRPNLRGRWAGTPRGDDLEEHDYVRERDVGARVSRGQQGPGTHARPWVQVVQGCRAAQLTNAVFIAVCR